jgi:hypothetical protein
MKIDNKTLLALVLCALALPLQAAQSHYPSPEAALDAFVEMVGNPVPEKLKAVLGDNYQELGSGDPVAEAEDMRKLAEAVAQARNIHLMDDNTAILELGNDNWPLPIPLVKTEAGWRFDTEAGKEEVINRHIGRDELHALAALRAAIQAQEEYRSSQGQGSYALKFASSEGARDGLFWPVAEGEEPSPLGPFMAEAEAMGYKKDEDDLRVPYYGYFFRILTAQGANAPGGAKDYLKDGRLSEGFALIAFPAEYAKSGVKTFIVNQRGIIFEKDLGEETLSQAAIMQVFDPDSSWHPVEDPSL